MDIPSSIPKPFADIIEACWEEANNRPTFGDLVNAFTDLVLPTPRTPHPRIKGASGAGHSSGRIATLNKISGGDGSKGEGRKPTVIKYDHESISLSPNPLLKTARSPTRSNSDSYEETEDDTTSASTTTTSTTTSTSSSLQPTGTESERVKGRKMKAEG